MLVMAIDGACRRNGKADCVSAGGVFSTLLNDGKVIKAQTLAVCEHGSTNQRGELLALLTALDHTCSVNEQAYVITDSEYLYNAMTKDWISGWDRKGWVTATDEPVKNKDIWWEILQLTKRAPEVMYYHIKGHVIPFGAVTAKNLLSVDPSGMSLYRAAKEKFLTVKPDKLEAAQELSLKNNGFKLLDYKMSIFVSMNIVADAVATERVEAADAASKILVKCNDTTA